MSRYSSNFEFSSDMTKKLIFGHLVSLGPHKRRATYYWGLYRSPLKGLGSFSTLTPIEKFRRGLKSNFWPLRDTPYKQCRINNAIYKTAIYVVAGFITAVSKMAEYTAASIAADCLSLEYRTNEIW